MMSVVIIINNYLHDVASAVLVTSAVVLWALDRAVTRDGVAGSLLEAAYPRLVKLAWISLAWIIIGGIPRTIFFSQYEWDPAVVKGIVPALIIKHVLMFGGVAVGAVIWRRISLRLGAWGERPS
ncbi:MAG: hypothetical protein JXR33_04620 [Coriobacteriia bacterium]|nr:hypothetical protein [Coriobacteriia bacterium]